MQKTVSLKQQQQQFASHIRDPENHAAPNNIEDRRMAVYRELFFNNVLGFISNSFPVLKSIFSDEQWLEINRDFFIHHSCHTPLFAEISQEFIHYLQHERKENNSDPIFMLELAHYEWVEMAVLISDADKDQPIADPNGDLLAQHPVLSPVMQNLSYQFPVHTISLDNQPAEISNELTHLVVYRNRQDEVHFLQINAITQQLIETLKQNDSITGLDSVRMIAEELQHPQPEVIIEAGTNLLYELRQKDIILGTAV